MTPSPTPRPRYGIAEWYGHPLRELVPAQRQALARIALGDATPVPHCPFQAAHRVCTKRGGVCSLQRVQRTAADRMGAPAGPRVITCPHRFEEGQLVVRWLADIVGFDPATTQVA